MDIINRRNKSMARTPSTTPGGESTATVTGGGNQPTTVTTEPTDTATGAVNNPAAENTAPPPDNKIMLKVTGAVATTTEVNAGETLGDVLTRAGIDNAGGFNYRSGNQPVALTRPITESMDLTAVAKARHG
jgi:hypothetical protein